MNIRQYIKDYIINLLNELIQTKANVNSETELLALGKILCNQQVNMKSKSINDYEFKIFSQCGDDGIIQYLIRNLEIENDYFIEFGVGDFTESNCRFLMMNNNWSGLVMDSSFNAIKRLKKQKWYWMYDLEAKAEYITKDNINYLISSTGEKNIGILHIDIDGNDFHILKKLNLEIINPSIIIVEYNSLFGFKRAITVPYRSDFNRSKAHYSNLYFGASLRALDYISKKRGYSLVGTNSTGNNAYFIRKDLLNSKVEEVTIEEGYHYSKFREGRDNNNNFSLISGENRLKLIKGLEVENVISGEIELL